MSRAVGWCLAGFLVFVTLAGCGRFFLAEREPWRREAEAACIKSGAVRESRDIARIKAIDGPGICGADFPLKVAALGGGTALGFGPEPRPPGLIPGVSLPPQPRWPIVEPGPYNRASAPPMPVTRSAPAISHTLGPADLRPSPLPAITRPPDEPRRNLASAPDTRMAPLGAPLSLRPPGLGDPDAAADGPYDFRRPYINSGPAHPVSGARPLSPPTTRSPTPSVVPLGPTRAPLVTGSVAAAINPPATLACPMVSALDTWIATTVQPAALRWFNQPVVEIKQISAYSCRGMNGQPGARISEHAFGNALDIAAFTFADGRKVTVKEGWRGAAEEQGFLRDVQGGACDQFHTVLAPGSNRFHYDHIHVDLMRRGSGRVACNPAAVPGEVVAARVRAQKQRQLAQRAGEPSVTGSIGWRRPSPSSARLANSIHGGQEIYEGLTNAIPGEDDLFEDDEDTN